MSLEPRYTSVAVTVNYRLPNDHGTYAGLTPKQLERLGRKLAIAWCDVLQNITVTVTLKGIE